MKPEPLVAAADVPVAGGVILRDRNLVVTQPVDGEFRAFGARVPAPGVRREGDRRRDDQLPLPRQRFRIADGSVAGGPSPSGLPAHDVVVVDGMVTLRG